MIWNESDEIVHLEDSIRNGDFEVSKQTIITGDVSRGTEEAIEWLKANGATVEDHACLSIITLPESLSLEYSYPKQYTVSDKATYGEDGYVEIFVDADPYKIEFRLEK